tara:strand:+ start:175 stop:486 length:312 start_codon:yes stop_codon:yes gene_type:complete
MQFYDLINNNLKHLSLQTEMLESCEWDEGILETKIQFVQFFLKNWTYQQSASSWDDIRLDLRVSMYEEYLKAGYDDLSFLDIIMKVIEHNRNEILQMMELGEN